MREACYALAALLFVVSTKPASATEIYLVCNIHDQNRSWQTKLEISDLRVVVDGEEKSREVTISDGAIVFKLQVGNLLFTMKIDRTTGAYLQEVQNLAKGFEKTVDATGTCSKIEAPSKKL